MKKNNPGPEGEESGGQWLAFLNLGWLIALNMLIFVGGGLWLDKRYKTAPVLLLIGVFAGFFVSGYTIYRAVKKLERDEDSKPHH